MSDSHGNSGNPYGDPPGSSGPSGPPPPPPNPYDQPGPPSEGTPSPEATPASAPSDPYGQPAAPANPYGERKQSYREKYGEAPSPEQAFPPGYAVHGYAAPGIDPQKRPGTVTAAGIITLVFAGLSVALYGIVLIALVVARQDVTEAIDDELAKQPGMEDIAADDVTSVILVVVAILLIWSLITCLLGVLVLRRSNIARILLVVSSSVTLLGSLLSITSGLSIITLLASGAVIVLLFVGGANEWFRHQHRPTSVPGTPTY
jgi:hypothetical protein